MEMLFFILCFFSFVVDGYSDEINEGQAPLNENWDVINQNSSYFTDPNHLTSKSDPSDTLTATTLAHTKKVQWKETFFGNPRTAKIKVTMYSSPTCTHCAEYHEKELPALFERVKSGDLFLIMRSFVSNLKFDLAAIKITWAYGVKRQHEFMDRVLKAQKFWLVPALQNDYPKMLEEKINQVSVKVGIDAQVLKEKLKITEGDPCGLLKLYALTNLNIDIASLEAVIKDEELEREILAMSLNAKESDGKYLTFTPAFYIQMDPNSLEQGHLQEHTPDMKALDQLINEKQQSMNVQ